MLGVGCWEDALYRATDAAESADSIPNTQHLTPNLRRLRLLVEYDGTDFAGFQLQAQGQRTVQGVVEEALLRLTRKPHRIHGAGRTDAGVHAAGQVVHFDTDWPTPVDRVAIALNSTLPRDCVVKSAHLADAEFHSRYSATARVYRYVVLNRKAPSALLGRFALHVAQPLDTAAMQAAAHELEGVHDFAAFGTPDAVGKSTVRRIDRIIVRPFRDCVLITVRGNAFLRSQVRAFAATLLEAGRGHLGTQDVAAIRDSLDRARCPKIAPAHGLTLVRVEYDGTRRRGDAPHLEQNEMADVLAQRSGDAITRKSNP